MPFYGLIGLFRVTGIREAQGARQRNARRNRHQKRRFRVRGHYSGTVTSTVARKHEENRVWSFVQATIQAHRWPHAVL